MEGLATAFARCSLFSFSKNIVSEVILLKRWHCAQRLTLFLTHPELATVGRLAPLRQHRCLASSPTLALQRF
jgi:hypothetical protein